MCHDEKSRKIVGCELQDWHARGQRPNVRVFHWQLHVCSVLSALHILLIRKRPVHREAIMVDRSCCGKQAIIAIRFILCSLVVIHHQAKDVESFLRRFRKDFVEQPALCDCRGDGESRLLICNTVLLYHALGVVITLRGPHLQLEVGSAI